MTKYVGCSSFTLDQRPTENNKGSEIPNESQIYFQSLLVRIQ